MKNVKMILTLLTVTVMCVLLLQFSPVEAQTACSNDRCDYRGGGQSYGCRLSAPNMSCDYTGGTCTGYTICDSTPIE